MSIQSVLSRTVSVNCNQDLTVELIANANTALNCEFLRIPAAGQLIRVDPTLRNNNTY